MKFIGCLLLLSFVSTPTLALQDPFLDDDWTYDEITPDTDEISYQNPKSYGELAPYLWGRVNSVALNVAGRRFSWTGIVGSRGVVSLWGEGALEWNEDDSLNQMDQKLRRLVDENPPVFQIQSKELYLSKKRSAYAGPFKTITYQRRLNLKLEQPVAVERAFVTFRFKWNRLIQITNHSYGKIGPLSAPQIEGDDALQVALEDLKFKNGQDQITSKVTLEIQPFFGANKQLSFRSVYQLSLRKKNPAGLWKYSIRSDDGSIARVMSGLHTTTVAGEVLPRLPQDSKIQTPFPFVHVSNGKGKEQANERGEFQMDPEAAVAELSGSFVKTLRGERETPRKRSTSDGVFFDAQNYLDESMAYFHITHLNQFAQRFIKSDFLRQPIVVNTKVRSQSIKSCNAWFDGGDKTLNFLEADKDCHNTSHIADILYHEWGHALDDALGGIQDGAFSEAVGDMISALMTGDSKLAPGMFKKDPSKPIRDMNVVKIYPRDQTRDPHSEGLIVGGAWYETLVALQEKLGLEEGRLKVADLFYRHLVSTDSYLDSYQGILVVDDDDGDLSNGTPHLCLLNPIFAKRGLADHDDRCR